MGYLSKFFKRYEEAEAEGGSYMVELDIPQESTPLAIERTANSLDREISRLSREGGALHSEIVRMTEELRQVNIAYSSLRLARNSLNQATAENKPDDKALASGVS